MIEIGARAEFFELGKINFVDERPSSENHFKSIKILLEMKKKRTNTRERERGKGKRDKIRVTRLGDLLDFGQLFKAFGNN